MRRSSLSPASRSAGPSRGAGRGGGRAGQVGDGGGGEPRVEPPAADHGAKVVGAGAPGDAEQPRTRGGAPLETGQRLARAQERLLRQVVGGAGVDQGGGETPHLGPGGADELGQGSGVARAGPKG